MEPPLHTASVPASAGNPAPAALPARSSGKRIVLITLGIVLGGCGIAAATTAWWIKRNIYADPIQPVSLTQAEQQTLDAKLHVLDATAQPASLPEASPGEQERTLLITAKELNAYLSQNLGENLKLDLGQDKISATMVVPVPADSGLPFVSGTSLRVSLAVTAKMDDAKKVALTVNDVRVGGVPMPNAWLGGIKGTNLTEGGLNDEPAMKRFLDGIQSLKITPEGVRIVLAE